MTTVLVFQSKRFSERKISLSDLREAQHLYEDRDRDKDSNIYYCMERAIRLLTSRYSGSEKSVMECGYALRQTTITSTTPSEQEPFLSETFAWAEALSPRELRKSLCSLGTFHQGWRLASIVKGDDVITVN